MERSRKDTEQRLLDAVGTILESPGGERLGINAVARQAGVSKMLIYRYFGSLDGLVGQYIMRKDFWIDPAVAEPPRGDLRPFVKELFHRQIDNLRGDALLVRLFRWELSSESDVVDRIRQRREENGLRLIEYVTRTTGLPVDTVRLLATMISGAVTYLAMYGSSGRYYNGYDLYTDQGWAELQAGIDSLIDKYLQ